MHHYESKCHTGKTMVRCLQGQGHSEAEMIKLCLFLLQLNTFKSNTCKSNFAQVEAFYFLFFISLPNLHFVWLCLQHISQKRTSLTSAMSNMLSLSHTRISRSQISIFNVESPRIPNLAAGHLDTLQHKPSRLMVVVCYCFGQWLLTICFWFITY